VYRLYFDQIKEWIIQALVVFSLLITLLRIVMWEWKNLRDSFSSTGGRKPPEAPPLPKT
jgi:hypothetical protein